MKKSLFAGSFDPPTFGHIDIIEKAAKLCDKLIVAVAKNTRKTLTETFNTNEKIELLQKLTSHLKNVQITTFNGLVSEFVKKNNIDSLIRGLRTSSEFEQEYQMALVNKTLGGVDTVFFMSDSRYVHLSSSLIKEIACFKGSIKHFVPMEVEKALKDKYQG